MSIPSHFGENIYDDPTNIVSLSWSQIPPNLIFQKVDLTQDLPFEEKKFDVIHARLVIMHVCAILLPYDFESWDSLPPV